ncbi:MAG: plasmid partitioning protein RepB C-terminal domain-containing protein [Candidatus Omnitrophota bacterium]
MSKVALGFDPNTIRVPLDNLLPSRKIAIGLLQSRKYLQILASIREVGVIEPISVIAADAAAGTYLLLDGHVRVVAMRDLGYTEANCLIAKDDEGYTYNTRINRVSSIQEHRMIRRAIDRGVSREKVANTLGVDVSLIHKKASLLDGVCDEAIEMLKDRQFSTNVTSVLRRMKPMRQVQCVELMIDCNKFTSDYANALLALTPPDMLVDSAKPRKQTGVTPEQLARMEREMANVQGQYKLVEQNYGQDVLNLVLAQRYLEKLLANKMVARYLRQHQPEVLEQFEKIVATKSLDQ